MDHCQLQLESLVKKSYVNQGLQNERARQNMLQILLNQKKMPVTGWNDQCIELAIHELSIMDSNNFASNSGVGEREGRVFSSLVARRHFNLAHGIGRSGDIAEVQPKAAGSSIIYKLTNCLALHAMEIAGLKTGLSSLVLPMATGMSLTMCFIAMKKKNPTAKYIIWPRIDQKSCFKSISTAGLIPLCVENLMIDEKMETNIPAIRSLLEQYGEEVLCVLATTSCFAPRQPDSIDEIAKLCKEFNCGHVINNAYGIQCEYICKKINRAITIGRVDAVVQSTDKNFLVPVGGAIVISPTKAVIDAISGCYPGRASMTPILDLFITLLSMGQTGYQRLLQERLRLRSDMLVGLRQLCDKHGLVLLNAPYNTISIGISLDTLLTTTTSADITVNTSQEQSDATKSAQESLTFLGSMLYQRCVSGCRVVSCTGEVKKVAGYDFCDWGAHMNNYPHCYFTVACSVGITDTDVIIFIERLDKVLIKFKKRNLGKGLLKEDLAVVDA